MSIFNFDKETTHVGFADEAYWNHGEFRAVACVSARLDNNDYHEVERRLCASRCDAGAIVSEIKWAETRTRDRQRDAAAALDTVLSLAIERKLHLDVLVWDERGQDFLDNFFGKRDNREEFHLHFMYRSLFSQVLSHWKSVEGSPPPFWTFAPDQHTGMDFLTLQQEIRRDAELTFNTAIDIDVQDVKGTLNYSIQLADFLAGLTAWSHQSSDDYEIWLLQDNLPDRQLYAAQWRTRFPILNHFNQWCQSNDLGPTMLRHIPAFTGRGLWTPEPALAQHRVNILPFAPLS